MTRRIDRVHELRRARDLRPGIVNVAGGGTLEILHCPDCDFVVSGPDREGIFLAHREAERRRIEALAANDAVNDEPEA